MPFHDARQQIHRRLVAGIWGNPGRGKTHLALTFPEPIYFFNFDQGVTELLSKPEFRDKDIRVATYVLPEEKEKDDYPAYLAKLIEFHNDFNEALANVGSGTIVMDTASQAHTLIQFVKLTYAVEKRKTAKNPNPEARPFDYGDANMFEGNLLRRILGQPQANAALIVRAKEVWNESGAPTGQFTPDGFKELPSIVQVMLETRRSNDGPYVRIGKCRADMSLEGLEVEGADYSVLCDLLLPGVGVEVVTA